MQLGGATSSPFSGNAQTASPDGLMREMRAADAALRGEARRIEARANAEGQAATVQVAYGRGPDGTSYVSSITVTRTKTENIGEVFRPRMLEDISPPRMLFTPSDMAEGFAERMRNSAQAIVEGLATRELQHADSGVRNHEGLHFRTAGGLATGLPELEYLEGPDGRFYAVAGQVNVRTNATSDPEKASRDAATYARAATAPGDTSAQDMSAARGVFAHAADTYGKALAARAAPLPEHNMVA